jgi:hypothetical protein
LRKRLPSAIAALIVIVVVVVAVFHNAAARLALSTIASLATGYGIRIGDVRLEAQHGALVDVHVSRAGQPVLDADRIDIYYNLRDLLPGSRHRFGLLGVTIDHPQLTLIHNENGTYNIAIPAAVSGGTRPATPNNVPLNFNLRVRNAEASLIDQYRYYKESRLQRVDGINADVSIDTANATSYLVTGTLQDTSPQPFRMAGSVDYVRGYALHHISVRAIPITTIGNYFINSPAAHILAGTVRNFDMRAWTFDVAPNHPAQYHMAGTGYLADGHIVVRGLLSPIDHLHGGITLFDAGFAARRLTANVGRIGIQVAGGIFDFRSPQFRLGIEGRGDLSDLKEVANFAAGLPIRGGVRFHALVEGDIGAPVLMIGYDGKQFNYQGVPIVDPHGAVALYQNNLIVLPFHGFYSGIKLHVQGNLQLGEQVHSVLALHAVGSSARIPYLSALLPDQPILTEILLNGTDLKVNGRGYIVSLRNPRNVNGFYAIDQYGNGAFGPISVNTPNGGSLVAAFDLDRPHGNSAFWASVRDVRLNQPIPVTMPGVTIPELPPMDAHIVEANVAGAGSARNVVIGGSAYLAPAKISGVPFNAISARFAGPFAASKMSSVHADGPWGTFDGNGTFGSSIIVARGDFAGTLQGLRPFMGNFPAQGAIHGPLSIAIAQSKIYVQAQNAQLQSATIHGIPISAITGTMAVEGGMLHVYSAQAKAAGGTVVAAGTFATVPNTGPTSMAIATTQLDAGALKDGFGVPLAAGALRAVGAVAPGAQIPDLNAGVVLTGGKAASYGPFSTSAEVSIAGDALQVRDAIASLGTTYAHVDGSIGGLAAGVPQYDVHAQVPSGDIAAMAHLASMPTYNADGSFEGDVQIGGTGTNPTIRGTVGVPVGSINGLGFRLAQANVSASRSGASVQHGSVQVGSTSASFSATVAKSETAFSIRSPHADLSDFNDYFDTGDTLAGTGALALSFGHFGHVVYTSGDIDVSGLRYRRLPIGDTDADWTSLRNLVRGRVAVGGDHGRMNAYGTIAFASSPNLTQLITQSRYDIHATLRDFDLTTWLPAFGFPQVPVTGRVNGDATLRGSYPHLAVTGDASIHDGTLGPLPIRQAEVSARTIGDRIDITRMVFALPALDASGSGSFGLSPAAPISLQVHAITNDLPRLVAQLSKKQLNLKGRIESTLSIGGTLRSPRLIAGIDASNLDAYGVQIPSFIAQVQLHRRDLVVRNAEIMFAHGSVTIAGSLPLQLQPFAFGPLSAPISMDAAANNLDLSTFASLMGYTTKLGGVMNGHIGISGTVRDPRIFGQLAVSNGNYVSSLETVPITQTVAQMTFEGTRATLDRVHAQLGGGTLDASGSLSFGGGLGGGPLAYSISLVTRHAQLATPEFGSGTFDSLLNLQRAPGQLALLKGRVNVTDATLPFNAFLRFGGGGGTGTSSAPPFNLAFNLDIAAGRNVRVRGGGVGLFGMDISGQGAAHLAGTLLRPTLSGQFSSSGGTLTYIDHAFHIQNGVITFPGNGVIPDVYAVATTQVSNPDPNLLRNPTGTAQITATVTGPVTSPKVGFTSDPAGYTEQQIVALLLPLGGLVGPIQFTQTGVILPAGQLAGAPAAGTGAPLPNIFVQRQNGTLTIGQEAFNILNAQFANGLLSPVQNALSSTLGLSDVNLSVDYTGAVGINLQRPLFRDFYGLYGTTFSPPTRQTFGFAYQPNASTSMQFTMFVQQGLSSLLQTPGGAYSPGYLRASAGQAVQGNTGFTFLFQRLY